MRKIHNLLAGVTGLVALPFVVYLLLWPVFLAFTERVSRSLVVPTYSEAILFPFYLVAWLMSDAIRYLLVSIIAVSLILASLVWFVVRECKRIWQHKGFYWLSISLISVLVFPFLGTYTPAVEAISGMELRAVDETTWLARVVKRSQCQAGVPGYGYEPLGWKDAQTLVYRRWRQGFRDEDGHWHNVQPETPQAYDIEADQILPFTGDLDALWHETCFISKCVMPLLAEKGTSYHYAADHLAVARFQNTFVSPDGRWVVFTASHITGPEDLFIMAQE